MVPGLGHLSSYSLNVTGVHNAKAGRSARSYINENRLATLAETLKADNIVIIEVGHNNGGSLTPIHNGRSHCVGAGREYGTNAWLGLCTEK
jgi:rhamnogalacturonan acetylesterase